MEDYPIVYFDATGGIFNKIRMQENCPLLFSLVCHDKSKKQIIPMCEFITTDHTSLSIAKYLDVIHLKLIKRKMFIPVVVTDFAYPLINSVMKCFNKCTLTHYLEWCYYILFDKEKQSLESSIKTRLYLCSFHILKSLIAKAKRISKEKEKRGNIFVFSFTLLQNSNTISDFEEILWHVYNLFNNPVYSNSVHESLKVITTGIDERNSNSTNISKFFSIKCMFKSHSKGKWTAPF